MKKIGVVTSGGDAPGMNAAVRAVVREAVFHGIEVIGIERGFLGLFEDQFVKLDARSVGGIINKGGTIIRTGRCSEIRTRTGMNRAVNALHELAIEGLVVIGGDGSLKAGTAFSKRGIPVVCVPASIDNDIYGTDETIGFDTAFNTAVQAIDKIRDTATSHDRIFIVEVMGREHGFLTQAVGLSAGAEYILVPEIKYNHTQLCSSLRKDRLRGKTSVIIVFAEGAGNPYEYADRITKSIGGEVRVSSLGYIQRGGTPTARSRYLASMFGSYAVQLLREGKNNRLIVLNKGTISNVSLSSVIGKEKTLDHKIHALAKRLAT